MSGSGRNRTQRIHRHCPSTMHRKRLTGPRDGSPSLLHSSHRRHSSSSSSSSTFGRSRDLALLLHSSRGTRRCRRTAGQHQRSSRTGWRHATRQHDHRGDGRIPRRVGTHPLRFMEDVGLSIRLAHRA